MKQNRVDRSMMDCPAATRWTRKGAAVILLGAVAAWACVLPAKGDSGARPHAGPSTPAEQLIFIQANQDRARHGVGPLVWDASLARAAMEHALRMAAANAISHQFAGEPDLQTRAMQAGEHFSVVAENVAVAPDPREIEDLWMHSPGHRANLLNPQLDAIGIAVVERGGEWFAVQDFSRRVEQSSLDAQERQVAALVQQSGVAVIADQKDARASCAMDEGHAGSRQPRFMMRYTAADLGRLPEALVSRLKSGKYSEAAVGACSAASEEGFSAYRIAVMLY